MRLAALVLAVSAAALADVPSLPRRPIAPMPSCQADTDCVITAYEGCCGSCTPREPWATSKESLELQQRRCAAIDCSMPRCEPSSAPPPRPVSAFLAVCRAGQCERVEKTRGDLDACASSADCTLTTTQCCPRCCSEEPRAATRARARADLTRCQTMDCESIHCEAVRCAPARPVERFTAECAAGRCVRREAPLPLVPGECRADGDCRLVEASASPDAACHRSPCGCCPGAFRAAPVSREKPEPVDGVAPRHPSTPTVPPLGLSEGTTRGGPRPPTVNCSPCPAPPRARAACQAARCVVVMPER